MNAVIYCRVSTKEQTQNLSLSTQLKACLGYCERSALGVSQTFVEEGESAKTANRPELQRLLKYCRENKGRLHCVVVYNVSRLAREKQDHFALRALLQKLGITLRSVTEPVDDSPTGKFIEGVLAAAAQFDNDVKAERTRAGMLAAMQMGRWCHQAPLGYRTGVRPGPSLTAEPERSQLILRGFEEVAAGATERDALRAVTGCGPSESKGQDRRRADVRRNSSESGLCRTH
jgi:DNA invertase Pin-like site-specific DNA recombinase